VALQRHRGVRHPFPGVPELAFSSQQTLELAIQVRPFIKKNAERIEERAQAYQAAVEASFATQLRLRRGDLARDAVR